MDHVKVLIKLRPRTETEVKNNVKEQWTVDRNILKCPAKIFNFDHIFGQTTTISEMYSVIAPMIEEFKGGSNVTILSYGQKSSGKTTSLMGVFTKSINQLINQNESRRFTIRVGYIEIFNNVLYDLLNRRQIVHCCRNAGIGASKLSNKEVFVKNEATIIHLLDKGNKSKTPTSVTETSCSHTIFQITIESQDSGTENINEAVVSVLSFVDLDRSEGAHIKNEKGTYVDTCLESLELAITTLSKGEKFQDQSKSKLTRLLRLGENAITAIIFNITPTSLNQSLSTLNIANDAKVVETKTVKVRSNDTILSKVQQHIAHLYRLKAELEPMLLNVQNINEEIAELQSIILTGMRSTLPSSVQILKIRQFFPNLIGNDDRKYQIGEMKDSIVDAQSRPQRKNTAFKWSELYLERVGFELNVNMRRQLKYGKNSVGRSDVEEDVDICIDSLECSRKHCEINVSDNLSVSIEDLNSFNGTMVNGVRYKGKKIELNEGDIVTIVGGLQSLSSLVGNFYYTAYRLCKSANDKISTYDIDDDDIVIEIDDDDDDGDVVYFPVKMEMDTPQPSQYVEVVTEVQTENERIADTRKVVEQEMVIDSENVAETEMVIDTGCIPDQKQHNGFDLFSLISDGATFVNLNDINITPLTSLSNFANELELMDKLEQSEKIRMEMATKIEQLNSELNSLKKGDNEKRDTISQLQSQLLTSALQKNVLVNEHSEMCDQINVLKEQLKSAEEDVNSLRETNVKYVNEIMAHLGATTKFI